MSRSEVGVLAETGTVRARASVPAHQVVLTLGLVLTFVAYAGSIGYQFVYDDHAQIITNSFVHSWRFAPRYFIQHVWESILPGALSNYYRPLFLLWLRVNHMLFGLRPWGWHLTTILAHLGVTLSVYFLTLRIVRDRLAAAFAAMIFGLHPVHVEGVVWVSGVTEPLLGLMFIPAFISHLKMRDDGSRARVWLAVSLFLFLAALFAKETAMVFPLLIFAYEWLFGPASAKGATRASLAQRLRNATVCALRYLAVTPLYLVPRAIALKGLSHALTPLPLSTIIFTVPSLLWFYLKRLLWPVNMTLSYNLPYVQMPSLVPFVLPSAGIAAAGFILWTWARRPDNASHPWGNSKARVVAFCSVWILLPTLPVLNASVLPMNDFVHDRYMYLPSVGFAMLAAMALRSIEVGPARVSGRPAIQFVLAAAVGILCVWGALLESIVWSNDLLLYYRGATISPNNNLLKTNLAYALVERGHYQEAVPMFLEVVSETPKIWEANYDLGLAYYKLGNLDEARKYLQRAIALNPTKAAGFLYLGLTELKLGHLDEAAAAIHQAVRINPDVYGLHFARGMVLKLQGDLSSALEEFKEELALNPDQQATRDQILEIETRLRSPRSEGLRFWRPAAS